MRGLGNLLGSEFRKVRENPARLRQWFRVRRVAQLLAATRFFWRHDGRWQTGGSPGLQRREYRTYAEYVTHQQSKLNFADLAAYDRTYRAQLHARLAAWQPPAAGAPVLCLAARLGTEVRAFQDLGCFAVGVDLNPGPQNRFVLFGDFHELAFPAASAAVVFTNSLDHAFALDKLLGEVRRVLQPEGCLIVEAVQGDAEGVTPDFYASLWWSRVDDLVRRIEAEGFQLAHRHAFTEPWPGEHLRFAKSSRTAEPAGHR